MSNTGFYITLSISLSLVYTFLIFYTVSVEIILTKDLRFLISVENCILPHLHFSSYDDTLILKTKRIAFDRYAGTSEGDIILSYKKTVDELVCVQSFDKNLNAQCNG